MLNFLSQDVRSETWQLLQTIPQRLTMASASSSTEVEREAMCPICLECLSDPVTLDCRHNFCRSCITGYCEKRAKVRPVRCPLCKTRIQKGTVQRNWQLSNIVEKIKLGKLTQGKENMCKKHNEKLQLFCKEDEELVCLICEHSPEHHEHSVLLLDEVVQEYRDKLKIQQKSLEKDRGDLVDRKLAEELNCQEHLAQLEDEKQKVSSVFQEFHMFLEEKEIFRLSQLDELKKEIEERHEDNASKLSKEISRLNKWIKKMERKCQQPAIEFLQNIGNTLKNYENKEVGHTVVLSTGLEEIIRICSQKNTAIEKITEKYKEEAMKLMEPYETAVGTYSAPVSGPVKKTDCRPLGLSSQRTALKPSGLSMHGEHPQTSRAPSLPPGCFMGPVKGPRTHARKPPAATPTFPLYCTCEQSGHLKWDCPYMDFLQADVWNSMQAWQENDSLSTEAEDDILHQQSSEADISGEHDLDYMLTTDQEQQQAKFWTWTKGAVTPFLEGCGCEVPCHHCPLQSKMLGQHSASSCGDLAKTSRPTANSLNIELPDLTGSQDSQGWDQVQGEGIKESVGTPKGIQDKKVESSEVSGETEGREKEMAGESRDGGKWEVDDSSRDMEEETWNIHEEGGNMEKDVEKDQGPSSKGKGGDIGTRETEARSGQRERSGEEVAGKESGCRKGETGGGEGAEKEVWGDQGQQGESLQGQKESLSSCSKEQEMLGQGISLNLSGYRWSLGRGYKIIGYPLPPKGSHLYPGKGHGAQQPQRVPCPIQEPQCEPRQGH